jgi:tetratricopeptide (TPR) repeat protein
VSATRWPENQYSHVVDLRGGAGQPSPTVASALHDQLAAAHAHLLQEEYALALDAYAELDRRIAALVDPAAAAITETPATSTAPALLASAARTLQAMPADRPELLEGATVPATAVPFVRRRGVLLDPAGDDAFVRVELGRRAACRGDWRTARDAYLAVQQLPTVDAGIRAAVDRDLGVVFERCGNREGAIASLTRAIEAFTSLSQPADEHDALVCLGGIHERAGELRAADELFARADVLAKRSGPFADEPSCATDACCAAPVVVNAKATGARVPELRASAAIRRRHGTELVLGSGDASQRISLEGDVHAALSAFHEQRRQLVDPDLLDGQSLGPSALVAYAPHLHGFVIPMAIGDCQVGLQDFPAAEQAYLGVLAYQGLNETVETVKLWQRMADLYFAWGDTLYRAARRDRTQFAAAAARYSQVIQLDDTVDAKAPLYADPRFASLGERAQAAARAEDPVAHDENPAIKVRVMRPRQRLAQIAAGLDFFGFPS